MSNFLSAPFIILFNFPYKFVQYLKPCYLKFSLCRTTFSVSSVIFRLFPIPYLEHLNEVLEWIILFISGIRMLVIALIKLCSEVSSFLFQHRSDNNMSSVKWKLSVKGLDEECQALRDLEKGISNKDVAEKYGVRRNTILTWGESKWNYFLLEIWQRFESFHVHEAARKESSILTYFTENKYQFL